MRTLLILCFLMAVTLSAHAAAPTLVNYQGRLTDPAGDPVADGNYSVVFTIYDDAVAGSTIWTETQNVTTTAGLFSILLGSVTAVTDNVFNGTTRYLGLAVDGDPELTPRTALVSVPYALRVSTVDGASGGRISSSVGVGTANTVTGQRSMASGQNNTVSGDDASATGSGNSVQPNLASIGGGANNQIIGSSGYSVIGGGNTNLISNTLDGTIAGGFFCNLTNGATFGAIAGGNSNTIDGALDAAIGGGRANTVSAGSTYGTIPGGEECAVSAAWGIAMGRRAKALHQGAFVWGDATAADVASGAANQFVARATGGAAFFSNAALTTGVNLVAGGGAWAAVSDRNMKKNIRPVDGNAILEKLSQLDISRWNYITQDESVDHIGPMAQDFYALFEVGDNDKTITTVDPDGISLAAIKALYEKSKRVDDLEAKVARLEAMVEQLSAR